MITKWSASRFIRRDKTRILDSSMFRNASPEDFLPLPREKDVSKNHPEIIMSNPCFSPEMLPKGKAKRFAKKVEIEVDSLLSYTDLSFDYPDIIEHIARQKKLGINDIKEIAKNLLLFYSEENLGNKVDPFAEDSDSVPMLISDAISLSSLLTEYILNAFYIKDDGIRVLNVTSLQYELQHCILMGSFDDTINRLNRIVSDISDEEENILEEPLIYVPRAGVAVLARALEGGARLMEGSIWDMNLSLVIQFKDKARELRELL